MRMLPVSAFAFHMPEDGNASDSKKVTLALNLFLPTLAKITPSAPIGFKLSSHVLGKYLLNKMKYELPAQQGYVLAEFEGRQLVPKTMRAGGSLEPALISSWVQLRIENIVSEHNENGSIITWYGDIVAYIWKDGLFTEPETTQGFQIEYLKKWSTMISTRYRARKPTGIRYTSPDTGR